jgi:aryl-alcohol dehydrogenase-like predicted oxidoreductase
MKFTKFGGTGLTVSRLFLGTGTFGTQADEAVACQILDKAAGAGVNVIDTADIYPMGPDRSVVGRAEEIVGRWLRGRRDQFIIATKVGAPMGPAPWQQGGSRKHILDGIDESLKRLGTDYVDLYQLHFDDPETPLDETLEALDTIVRAGKARYIGVSNFLAYRLARATGRAESLHLTRVASVQNRYSLLFRQMEQEVLPLAREEGIAVIPFNPLAGGLLSGKYRFEDKPTEGRFSSELGQQSRDLYHERYWHQQQFESIEHMKTLAGEIGEPLPKVAIAWVLANPTITSAILGASRPDQLTDTLGAVDLEVPAELKAKLDEITDQYRWG